MSTKNSFNTLQKYVYLLEQKTEKNQWNNTHKNAFSN